MGYSNFTLDSMKHSCFGMTTSESFVTLMECKSDTSDHDKNKSDNSDLSPDNSLLNVSINKSYLDLSPEVTDRWRNTLNGKKRSSLFADVKTIEDEGCCSVAYEYLCRLEEVRRYISLILSIELETLPTNLAFEHQLSNGVWLCQILDEVMPGKEIGPKVYDTDHDTYKEEGLVYRHQQNMCLFFQSIQELQFPDVLMPTIEEVYANENRIKLVYTAAALAYYLREIELSNHKIENLEKYLKFDELVLIEIITMLESKGLDLPSFDCLQALVDDELIYQKLKFETTPLPSPSLSLQEKSYMTMKPSKQDNSGDSDPENYYSNKTMEKPRGSKAYSGNYGPDGEPIYEDADKYIKSQAKLVEDFQDSFDTPENFQDSFDTPADPLESSTFISPSKSPLLDQNARRRKLSKSRVHIVSPNWGSSQLTMFPSRLEFNLFTCREDSIRVCMYTKPKIDMVIPTTPGKGVPTNLKPQLDKLKQAVVSNNTDEMMEVLKCKHFQLPFVQESKCSLYLEALKLELETSLNKCALAVYYGMKKTQSEKYLAQSEQGTFLLRVGKKSPPSLTFSFRSKRGIKHFKIQNKSNKLSLKKRDMLRHEYNFIEELIRELIDFLQSAHKLTLATCSTPDLGINPNLKECSFFTSLSLDKVQYCINGVHTDSNRTNNIIAKPSLPPKENPYTGLWDTPMLVPVDRFAAELLLLQYGTIGSYIVRPKVEGQREDYVISIRTENDVSHVKVVNSEKGFSIPNSSETSSTLRHFVDMFTFKESQLANFALKPVRLPNDKIEELKRKDEERKGIRRSPVLSPPPVSKKCSLKKGQSLEDLIKPLPAQFSHGTMVTSSSGYEGDTDTLESIPPTPPPPYSPDKVFTPASSVADISGHKLEPFAAPLAHERSRSISVLNNSHIILEESTVEAVPRFCESIGVLSCPLDKSSLSPMSPKKQSPVKQRVSAVHTPLPPVPICSPQLLKKLADSLPCTPHDVQTHLNNEYDHTTTTAPPIPYRPHANTSSDIHFKEIMRQQSEDKHFSKPLRPLSIKLTSHIKDYQHPLPSSISTIDFSAQLRTEADTARMRKSSVGSRPINVNPVAPIKCHNSVERKVSTNLFPTQCTLPLVEDKPTPEPELNPEPQQQQQLQQQQQQQQLYIESWNSEQVAEWLEEIGLAQYKSLFSDNDIDGSVLSMLNNDNLRDDIGIQSFGHRSKILKQIKSINN